jgi:hypothetical protein
LLLTYGLGVKGILMKIGYTNLCNIIGNKVLHFLFINKQFTIKHEATKTVYINTSQLFKDFLNEIQITDTDIIRLGDFFFN